MKNYKSLFVIGFGLLLIGCAGGAQSTEKPQWRINQEATLERLCDATPIDRDPFLCDQSVKLPFFDRTTAIESTTINGTAEECTHTVKIGLAVYEVTLKQKTKGSSAYCITSMKLK
ncbi:MAG: hypothetical protein K1Y36_19070 [Blastocatellia bacterium]|nr:hypothetical protein [Blastocatellia bacterium]